MAAPPRHKPQGDGDTPVFGYGLYVSSMLNGYSVLARLPFGGGGVGPAQDLKLPYAGAISGGLGSGVYAVGDQDGAVFPLDSWTHPQLWFRTDPVGSLNTDD